MTAFHRTDLENKWATVRGSARLLIADIDIDFPDEISDVIDLETFNTKNGWSDLGATKTGIQISPRVDEEVISLSITGSIEPEPLRSSCRVITELAEVILENLQLVAHGNSISAIDLSETSYAGSYGAGTYGDSSYGGTGSTTSANLDQRKLGIGTPHRTNKKRLAVLFRNKDQLIRAFVFRKVQIKTNTNVLYNKTGSQQTLPVEFNCGSDFSISNIKSRIFVVYEQSGQ